MLVRPLVAGLAAPLTALQLGESPVQEGPEKVVNGTFDTATTGYVPNWTPGNSASISAVAGQLVITAQSHAVPYAHQLLALVAGRKYKARVSMGAGGTNALHIGVSAGGMQIAVSQAVGARQVELEFTAPQSAVYISVLARGMTTGQQLLADNVSVKEIL